MSARMLVAEDVGTALLLAVVVGSGVMGEGRAGESLAAALLAASFAGLLGVVRSVLRHRPDWTPLAASAYVGSAHWLAPPTSRASPAVALTDAFTGTRPIDAPTSVAAQVVIAALGASVFGWLLAGPAKEKVAT